MTDVHVVGVGMTRFGKHPDSDATDLGAAALLEAVADAGIDPRIIEAAYVGHVFQGMVTGQRILAQVGLAGLPLANVENACSSGATAIREASLAIRAGENDVVVAIGTEHLTTRFSGALTPDPSDPEAAVGATMPGVYAMRATRYMEEYGMTREQLALIPVKNKANAAANPLAHFRKEITVADVLESRPIADPLRLHDCSPITDGAAAVIVMSDTAAKKYANGRGVRLAASTLRSGSVDVEPTSMTYEPLTWATAKEAYEKSGIGPDEVDFAEVHDCFSIAEVLRVEGLGLFEQGSYPWAVERGEANIDGRLPINPSGGLLGKGHPLGGTGVAQVVELVRQLRGEAGDRQIEGVRVGLAHCRGGKAVGIEGAACTVQILIR
ncbi:MAG: thiolase family protein [Actinomycetota bacterium]|nr:thiolase family protein [Actinomycetota bacterium]MDK1015947.1 thiolase family protein [Actinomycetota bacterium]MDK1027212.1 thiolase family protein [Actinomycetota bacterium]MDK1038174.1 thiolase family protein [Actinomycetota bacterium]MDK1095828.1 thiolase family protein [Actinomycetota bacterium]